MALKYKVGDKVRIKSIDWYNENKDELGKINCGKWNFIKTMTAFCDKIMTISNVGYDYYKMLEDYSECCWTDEMIEGLVEEETKPEPKFKVGDKIISDVFSTKDDKGWKVIDVERTGYRLISVNNSDLICDMDFKNEHYYKLMEEETKPEPKFKVGDILFYRGETCGYLKVEEIREENGEIRYYETSRNIYLVENYPDVFVDKVCSVETEETKPIDFTIKATDTKGKVEVVMSDGYGYEIENDKLYFISKKKEYPNTYEKCCDLLSLGEDGRLYTKGYKASLIQDFQKLLICRDAYWKIAGEEMGLGKPWEPDWEYDDTKYVLFFNKNEICHEMIKHTSYVLAFPTEEMRDAFYENFKKEIEKCKELL